MLTTSMQKTLKHYCLFPGELFITSTESTWRNLFCLSRKSIPPLSNTKR